MIRGGPQLFSKHHPQLIVEFFSDAAHLERARELLPDYRFEQLTKEHWLLT